MTLSKPEIINNLSQIVSLGPTFMTTGKQSGEIEHTLNARLSWSCFYTSIIIQCIIRYFVRVTFVIFFFLQQCRKKFGCVACANSDCLVMGNSNIVLRSILRKSLLFSCKECSPILANSGRLNKYFWPPWLQSTEKDSLGHYFYL